MGHLWGYGIRDAERSSSSRSRPEPCPPPRRRRRRSAKWARLRHVRSDSQRQTRDLEGHWTLVSTTCNRSHGAARGPDDQRVRRRSAAASQGPTKEQRSVARRVSRMPKASTAPASKILSSTRTCAMTGQAGRRQAVPAMRRRRVQVEKVRLTPVRAAGPGVGGGAVRHGQPFHVTSSVL